MILNQQNSKSPIERAIYSNNNISIETDSYTSSTTNNNSNIKNDKRLSSVPIKTSFQQFVLENDSDKKIMTKNEIEELRNSVIRTNRPLNPWFETQKPTKSFLKNKNDEDLKINLISKTPDHHLLPSTSQPINNLRKKISQNNFDFFDKNCVKKNVENNSLYEAKIVKVSDNKLVNDSITLKTPIKNQQKQNKIKKQESYSDYDISRALASDIKMLEQLEVEHQQRSNRIMANGAKPQNNIFNLTKCNNEKQLIDDYQSKNQYQTLIDEIKNYSINSDYNNSVSGTSSSYTTMSSSLASSPNNLLCYSPEEQKIFKLNNKQLGSTKSKFNSNDKINKLQKKSYNDQKTKKYYNKFDNNNNINAVKNSNLSKNDNSSDENYSDKGSYTTPICYVCDKKISDVILQALGETYHPQCFCCTKCHCCLDGVPFAVDTIGKVFCMEDYENIFISPCIACQKPISAINEFGQIIRVEFQKKEYHIECFSCEGCGLQLSNEEKNRCYPISSHLLCRQCHFQWKRTGGVNQPITDL